MKIQFGQKTQEEAEQAPQSKGRTTIAKNLIKTRVILDLNGNEVDLRGNIIKRAGSDE